MYEVLKGFANNEINATKGKIVDINDKKLASSLLEAGYIKVASKKEVSSKEKDDEIKKLSTELTEKDAIIEDLQTKIAELEEMLSAPENTVEETDNSDEDNKNEKEDDNTLDDSNNESKGNKE